MVRVVANLPYRTSALLFDLDDTLYDRGAAFARWASAFVQAHVAVHGPSQQEALALLIALDGQGYTPRKDLFAAFLERYPGFYPVDELIETYYQQFSTYMEYAHLPPLLRYLQDARVPFGIITNGFARQQRPKIAALGLDTLTSCIFISEVFGAEKPQASIFLAAASCLGVPTNQILFVGDNPAVDVYGAHQVGMKTAWLRRFAQWPVTIPFCADMIIHSLGELLALLCDPHASW